VGGELFFDAGQLSAALLLGAVLYNLTRVLEKFISNNIYNI
jgi:hypothetical protein